MDGSIPSIDCPFRRTPLCGGDTSGSEKPPQYVAVPRCFTALVAAIAALASAPASAATIFAASTGDWFDGASWNTGVAPTSTDDVVIDNGGTATASSSSPGAVTPIEVNSLAVGSRTDAAQPDDPSGTLDLENVDLSIAGDLLIGADRVETVTSTLTGSVVVAGGADSGGNVIVGGSTRVGLATSLDFASSATASLVLDGGLETRELLSVGAGQATGEASVGGDLRIVPTEPDLIDVVGASVFVGTSGAFGFTTTPATPAQGVLSVDGDLSLVYDTGLKGSLIRVGWGAGAARSDGRVDVSGDVLGFRLVEVGVARAGFPGDGETIVRGELHVGGKLDEIASFGRPTAEFPALLSVGVNEGSLGAPGSGSAEGYATIGEIESRSAEVGIVRSTGPATGVLEIGTGDLARASVGESNFDGDASGTLITGGAVGVVSVGVSRGKGNAVGSVTAAGTGFTSLATVGTVDSDGAASGYLSVEGFGDSNVAQANSILVGGSNRGAGTADGQMIVRSGGIDATSIHVGRLVGLSGVSNPPANASVTGILESTGDVTSSSSGTLDSSASGLLVADAVGYANSKSGGHANGAWIMHEGTYTGKKLIVGVNHGASTVTGKIHLDQMLIDVDDITLGDGATVELEIQGLLRGAEYSAIDATVAKLNGALAVQFVAPAQLGIYDLLVSGGLDGITGAFDAVSVTGLAAGQSAYWGVETTGGASPVEIFRLYVVPEPQTGVLVALGLVGIAIRARANRRAHSRAV
jgi:hypothetical protein